MVVWTGNDFYVTFPGALSKNIKWSVFLGTVIAEEEKNQHNEHQQNVKAKPLSSLILIRIQNHSSLLSHVLCPLWLLWQMFYCVPVTRLLSYSSELWRWRWLCSAIFFTCFIHLPVSHFFARCWTATIRSIRCYDEGDDVDANDYYVVYERTQHTILQPRCLYRYFRTTYVPQRLRQPIDDDDVEVETEAEKASQSIWYHMSAMMMSNLFVCWYASVGRLTRWFLVCYIRHVYLFHRYYHQVVKSSKQLTLVSKNLKDTEDGEEGWYQLDRLNTTTLVCWGKYHLQFMVVMLRDEGCSQVSIIPLSRL